MTQWLYINHTINANWLVPMSPDYYHLAGGWELTITKPVKTSVKRHLANVSRAKRFYNREKFPQIWIHNTSKMC